MSVTLHSSRQVKTWKMFTADGQPVYIFGSRGYTLESERRNAFGSVKRQQARCFAFDGEENRAWRLLKASKIIGLVCEWRESEDSTMSAISF